MEHEDYKEMLPGQALTALDPPDARALEAHLQSCPDCRLELAAWEDSAAMLAFDAEPLEPAPDVRTRILQNVKFASSQTKPRLLDRNATKVAKLPHGMGTAGSRGPNLWAIAAALLLAALLLSLVVIWRQNRAMKLELAQKSNQVKDMEQQLEGEREQLSILTTPGARLAHLSGTKVAPTAHGAIAFDKNGRAVLIARGLPAVPSGKAYQLWFISDNKPLPGKLFTPEVSGHGMLEDQVPAEALKTVVFAITLEPASGVNAPTGAIYLLSGRS